MKLNKSIMPRGKRGIKNLLGDLPYTAEMYWLLRQRGRPLSRNYSFKKIQEHMPAWKTIVEEHIRNHRLPQMVTEHEKPKRVLIFAMLRVWIEHATLLSLGMAGLGHEVTLAYLPYTSYLRNLNQFDQRRQALYAQTVLEKSAPVFQTVSFYTPDTLLNRKNSHVRLKTPEFPYGLPEALATSVDEITLRDVQYSLQIEKVDPGHKLYRLRLNRNIQAAHVALEWIQKQGESRPEIVLTPNGSILEGGVVYAVARYLGIPVVTYEFGEQRGRIWLAQNAEVMRQETGALWTAYLDGTGKPLSLIEEQNGQIRALFSARQGASLWENFSRRWQGQPSQGGEQVRQALGLDRADATHQRPLVLLAANVIGDSLTLGRQVFSQSMTEWLERTVQYFLGREDVQLVVRIHPGERYTKGPSVADVIRQLSPSLPAQIHLVEASDPTNTYDIVELADLGLVYTTTTGMEMAMSGLPVIVAGQTHYRAKGFTIDPHSWDEYFECIEKVLSDPATWKPDPAKVERVWNYAYRFFFDYPLPFPWHLHFWEELPDQPLEKVLSPEGQAVFGEAFRCLAGEPRKYIGV
jgi:hypothetical protein